MGMTTFSGPVRSLAGFINMSPQQPLTAAALTLTPADNGANTAFNSATAQTVTLPFATSENIGLHFTFSFLTAAPAAGTKIKTATTTPGDRFVGSVYSGASAGAVSLFIPAATNDVITLDGATKGGAVGTTLTVTCTAVNTWTVAGNLVAVGAPATPFADA